MFVAQLLAFEMRIAAAHVRAARGRGRFFFADGLGFLVCFHGEIGFWKAPTALTKRRFPITFCALPCRDGGIGRRTRFRSWRWQHCGGSSPLLGTNSEIQNLLMDTTLRTRAEKTSKRRKCPLQIRSKSSRGNGLNNNV